MPQAVKAQAAICPPFRRVARDLPFNARPRHDSCKLPAQAALAARTFASKGRKQKRLADAGRFQQAPFKLRVKGNCLCLFGLAWREGDKLPLYVYRVPPHIRYVAKPRARVV